MKQVFQDWWQGFQWLVRIGILLVCMVAGWAIPLAVQLALGYSGVHVPMNFVGVAGLIYVFFFCPFLVVSWARWCGYQVISSHEVPREHSQAKSN